MTQPTCRLVTLGCKVNQYETELLRETLVQNGFREADDGERADVCVVNTCTVTTAGDAKGRQLIRQMAKQNPHSKTLVMGCYAKRDPDALKTLPNVAAVATNRDELTDALRRLGIDSMSTSIRRFSDRQRAYVKIQDGCLLKCSYCIVPRVRPELMNRTVDEIESEVRQLIDNGYREIVITGIHIGHYGLRKGRTSPDEPPYRLWHLLQRLDRIPGEWRMRLTSLDTTDMGSRFLAAARDCRHLCPHFHPSLQSGSDTVLKRMRRRYRVDRFLKTLDDLRSMADNPAITTDVIVGFPGESDDDFERTLQVCRDARFMKIHIFPFSIRPGTEAAGFSDRVPADVIKQRCAELARLEQSLRQQYYASLIGREIRVLVEHVQPHRVGFVQGHDERYVPVELPGGADDVGKFAEAVAKQFGKVGVSADRTGFVAKHVEKLRILS